MNNLIPGIKVGDTFSCTVSLKQQDENGNVSDATLPATITSEVRDSSSVKIAELTVTRITDSQFTLTADTSDWPEKELAFDIFYQGLPGGVNLHSQTMKIRMTRGPTQ